METVLCEDIGIRPCVKTVVNWILGEIISEVKIDKIV